MTTHAPITIPDYEAFLLQPQNLSRRFELIHGEIVEKMPTQLHAYIIAMLNYFMIDFLRQHPLGYTLIEARYRLPGDDANDLIPDLSFVTKAHGALVRHGATPYMPDLAAEAQSDGQSDRFMIDKAHLYLANGTRMVWLFYSQQQIVEVLTPTDRHLLTALDTLSGGDMLPGFSVPVRDLFPTDGM